VKEPAHGSLGRADDAVIRSVVAAVRGRRPVSAAMGEWAENHKMFADADLTYIKWGLAGCLRKDDWRAPMRRLLEKTNRPQVVLVAYADWECAQAPPVEEVFALARDHAGSVMLVDTHCKEAAMGKERPTLLDWLPVPWIEDLCERARAAQVKIALAGSLGLAEVRKLRLARPNWFAVRGAVCGGDRRSEVQVEKVRELVAILESSQVDETHAQAR
jgi:uncharacterized protein (UPF0264 family)